MTEPTPRIHTEERGKVTIVWGEQEGHSIDVVVFASGAVEIYHCEGGARERLDGPASLVVDGHGRVTSRTWSFRGTPVPALRIALHHAGIVDITDDATWDHIVASGVDVHDAPETTV
jgi:hypothetical protein